MPRSKSKRSRYTPPPPKKAPPSPPWVPALMFTGFGLGVLIIVLNYLGLLPGGASNGYLFLGPRLQGQVREGRPQTARPPLVVVGYASLALTLTVPVLGAVLAHLAP